MGDTNNVWGTQNNVSGNQFNADGNILFAEKGNIYVTMEGGQRFSRPFIGVPPMPAGFVGRGRELDQLRGYLQAGGGVAHVAIAALNGMGGVGKTSLATRLAWDAATLARFPGGAMWASLGPNFSLTEILNAWGDALGLKVGGVAAELAVQRIGQRIADQPRLIILDDIWAGEGERAAQLLRTVANPGCACLLTTRDRNLATRLAHHAITEVGDLIPAEAESLLLDFCPRLAVVDPAARPSVPARLAARLGYLPLALRLVAARLAEHDSSLAELRLVLGEMESTRAWLNLSDDRDRKLTEVIALSVSSLPDERHRAAVAALAAFAPKPESFTLAAALAVTQSDPLVIGLLAKRNLLETQPDDRFALHQIIADFTNPVPDPARARHAQHYLALMQQSKDEDWPTIEAEYPQIRHAWQWVSRAPTNAGMILDYIGAARSFQTRRAYWLDEKAWIVRGLELVQADEDRKTEATLRHNLAYVYDALGDPQQALDYYNQALPLRRLVGDRAGEASTLHDLGYMADKLGDAQQALDYYNQALPLWRMVGDRAGEAVTMYNMAAIYEGKGDYAEAVRLLEQVVAIDKAINHSDLESDIAVLEYIHGKLAAS